MERRACSPAGRAETPVPPLAFFFMVGALQSTLHYAARRKHPAGAFCWSLVARSSQLTLHSLFALNTVKNILKKYTAWIWKVLAPLGPWGVFAIAAVDGSLFGMPVDAVVAGYVYNDRPHFLST